MKPKTVALIPLRFGSKSIPLKNIKKIAGKPLCAWCIEAAANSSAIDEVYISTESEEIANVVSQLGSRAQILFRPDHLATDDASTESVISHFMEHVDFDNLVTIQATSPLITSNDLNSAIEQFTESDYDSMLSAVRVKRFFWTDNGIPLNYNPVERPRRQDFKGSFMENGAFYLTRREILAQHACRLWGKIGIYEMSEDSAIEVDEQEDWETMERVLLKRNKTQY